MTRIPQLDRPLADCTIPAMLQRRADEMPDELLLSSGTQTRTGAEQLSVVRGLGGVLSDAGVAVGDRIAMLSGNRLELLDTILAAAWIGAVAVPLNPALTPPQLRHALANSGARLLLADEQGLAGFARLDDPVGIERVLGFEASAEDPAGAAWVLSLPVEPIPAISREVDAAAVAPSDIAAILYTSGTTGPSKGVLCPHAQFYWWGRNQTLHMRFTRDDVLFTTLPLFHTNALNAFIQAVVSGASFVVARRFSASRFWQDAADCGATFTFLLGAMVGILLNRPESEFVPHTVRAALAPATPARMLPEFKERFGVNLVDAFGSTETNLAIAVPVDELRPGYLGVSVPGFDNRVIDPENGEPLPDGVPGELLIRSDQPYALARGYFGMPNETVKAWDDLWFHTGDRVVREADGWFRFLDRIKDIIRRRGENISSVEVESTVLQHPGVAAVAAYAVPSELGEEEVQVSVEVKAGVELDPRELIEFVEPHLPPFAVPRFIVFEHDLPRTANGKVSKAELRKRGAAVERWDREAETADR
ncbi:AMP-binding protein [Herbiconiux sp. YIM B11900]|uniref:AMP-binding protein n=1 Tax=Herbiconiux sp. YIM B11900 TaxID=3404131 RepID=UPI003F86BB9C